MKNYPAFIIDRSRRSTASRFSDDFVVCTDKEVGFIARIYKLPKSRREEFYRMFDATPEAERRNKYIMAAIGEAVVVLEVVRMLYEPVAHINRLPPLMKKALRAYIYGEIIPNSGSGYDDQIAALEDVLRMCESQRPRLIDMNGEASAERFASAIRGALDSVRLMKSLVKSEK